MRGLQPTGVTGHDHDDDALNHRRPPGSSSSAKPDVRGLMPQTPGAPGGATVLISADITRIFANDVTNSIIVLAIPEDYQVIKETIEKIDIVPRQVVIEGIIAQVNLTDNLSLGVAWALKTDHRRSERADIVRWWSARSITDADKTLGHGIHLCRVRTTGAWSGPLSRPRDRVKGQGFGRPPHPRIG